MVAFSLLGLSFTPSTLLLAPSAQAETDKTGVSEVVYEKTSNQDGEIPLQIINVSFDGEGNISNVAIQTPSPNFSSPSNRITNKYGNLCVANPQLRKGESICESELWRKCSPPSSKLFADFCPVLRPVTLKMH